MNRQLNPHHSAAASALTVYRIADHVKSVIDADGAVLLDIRQGKYFSLNGIAVEIWRQLTLGRTVAEIEVHLAGLYDAPEAVLQQDARTFLDQLLHGRLISADV